MCLTIAPVFFTAAIYLSLARLIPIHDPSNTYSRLKPITYTYCFLTADIISLVLQAAGGAIAATSDTTAGTNNGVNIMIAGLGFQVASLVVFSALCAELVYRVSRANRLGKFSSLLEISTAHKIKKSHMQQFELALVAGTIFILVRCAYRCAELSGGFSGDLANEEVPFMILESSMMGCATITMTIWYPGWCLKGTWVTKGGKNNTVEDGAGFELKGSRSPLDDHTFNS